MTNLENKIAPQDTATKPVYVIGIAGQSQIEGQDTLSHVTRQKKFDTARAVILDKYKRPSYELPGTTDPDRAGETHMLRTLTPGYAPNGAVNPYPWEDYPADPGVGPELSLGHTWCGKRDRVLAIAKLGIGGSRVFLTPSIPSWNVKQQGAQSYLQTYKESYWDPTIEQAAKMAGGIENVRILGFVWLQGFSDARTEEESSAYLANAGNMLESLREHIKPSDPKSIPVLVLQSPRFYDGKGNVVGYLEDIRTAQKKLSAGPNIHTLDTAQFEQLPDGHFTADGTVDLGNLIAKHFIDVEGITPDAPTA